MILLQRIFKFQFIIFISFFISLSLAKPSAVSEDSNEIHAVTEEDLNYRKLYAAQMLSYMNQTVDPCDSYYEYACGNFRNVFPDRYGHNEGLSFSGIYFQCIDFVEELLSRSTYDYLPPEYSDYFKVTKKFHSNCLNAQLLPLQKSEEYLNILKKIGGFPAVDATWKSDNFNWINMSAHMSNYDMSSLVEETIVAHYPYDIYFKLPKFGFDMDLHYDNIADNSKVREFNANRIKYLLKLYDVAEDRINKITEDIFEFLKGALNIMKEINEDFLQCLNSSNTSNTETVQFAKKWSAYYDITLLNGTEAILCNYFLLKLNDVVEQNKEAVANYLSLKFLDQMDPKLESKKYQKEYCTKNVWNALPLLMDNVYMKLKFNDGIRDDIVPIFNEIRQEIRNVITDADWLDGTAKDEALETETALKEIIGRYEDKNMTDRLINELKGLTFFEDASYERNLLNLKKFKRYTHRFHHFNVNELDDKNLGLEALIGMQPGAAIFSNFVFVTAGLLQPPVYHKSWPNSLKYGALGYSVAHEYTHGFKEFNDKTNCFADHYQKYFDNETKRYVNGKGTQRENVADSAGLRLALKAYRKKMEKKSLDAEAKTRLDKSEQMPGLNLSPEQLFFLGFSQMYCLSYNLKDHWKAVTDEHTPDKYRVLGALTNSADFTKAYGCKLGTDMNPSQNKCKLW